MRIVQQFNLFDDMEKSYLIHQVGQIINKIRRNS